MFKTILVLHFWSISRRGTGSVTTGERESSSRCLGEGADGAAALARYGLPPLQFSGGHPPLDALQVQTPVEQSSAQRNTDQHTRNTS